MREIIRIDKGDGSRSRETDDSRVRQTVNANYPIEVQEKVLADFFAGERQIANEFAIYEVEGFVPFAKRP